NRFLTRDLYEGAFADTRMTTDPYTGNRYAFAGGNPLSNIELDGHDWTDTWLNIATAPLPPSPSPDAPPLPLPTSGPTAAASTGASGSSGGSGSASAVSSGVQSLSDDQILQAYERGQACQLLYGAGGGPAQDCLGQVLSPNFDAYRSLDAAEAGVGLLEAIGYGAQLATLPLTLFEGGAGIVEAASAARTGVAAAELGEAAAGTVWDSIKATQSNYAGSELPRSFELTAGDTHVWVHPNATEHIAEYLSGMAQNGATRMQVDMATQVQLESLQAAVGEAARDGLAYNKLMNVGGWELMFGAPRAEGQLPALFHALYTG
ncbi:hypothetical protein, partial [Gandjariella thermophila]|uniref:hypothetical protein n=1 Tax=Gandjariella thermophila TaxID=1931992 RepID=UPI001CEF7FFF